MTFRVTRGFGRAGHGAAARYVAPSLCFLLLACLAVLFLSRSVHTRANPDSPIVSEVRERFVTIHSVPAVTGHGELVVRACLPVWNRSRNAVTVTKIVPSCGCAHVQLSESVIRPGATAQMTVEVQIPPEGGSKDVAIELYAADGKVLVHQFRALGFPHVRVDEPYGLIAIGKVPPNRSAQRSVGLLIYSSSVTSRTPSLRSVRSNSPRVRASFHSAEPPASKISDAIVSPAASATLNIHLLPDTEPGMRSTTVDVEYCVNETLYVKSIPLTWEVASVLACTPARVFVALDHGERSSGTVNPVVRVSSNDGSPFAITRVSSSVP